ncbi:PTS sugar transporter subunit IIB [Klebsiella pneumoniae]
MYKIMLCCSAGMSTSLLVRKMVEAANERDLPVQIDAYGVSEFDMQFPQYQVVLLGPQVKYMLKTLSDKAASLNIPVQPIDTMDYGMQRGEALLNNRESCCFGAPALVKDACHYCE